MEAFATLSPGFVRCQREGPRRSPPEIHEMSLHQIGPKGSRTATQAPPLKQRPPRPLQRTTVGLVVGNRGFFPGHLVKDGREEMLKVLESAGFDVVAVSTDDTRYGAVESREEAKACAAL